MHRRSVRRALGYGPARPHQVTTRAGFGKRAAVSRARKTRSDGTMALWLDVARAIRSETTIRKKIRLKHWPSAIIALSPRDSSALAPHIANIHTAMMVPSVARPEMVQPAA